MNAKDREEFIELKSEVSHIKENIDDIKESQESIKNKQEETGKKFDKLMFHLTGDPSTNTKGIVETSRGIEVRLSRLERIYLFIASVMSMVMMFRDKIVSLFV